MLLGGIIEAQIGIGGMVGWAWQGLSGRTFCAEHNLTCWSTYAQVYKPGTSDITHRRSRGRLLLALIEWSEGGACSAIPIIVSQVFV